MAMPTLYLSCKCLKILTNFAYSESTLGKEGIFGCEAIEICCAITYKCFLKPSILLLDQPLRCIYSFIYGYLSFQKKNSKTDVMKVINTEDVEIGKRKNTGSTTSSLRIRLLLVKEIKINQLK